MEGEDGGRGVGGASERGLRKRMEEGGFGGGGRGWTER